MVAWLGADTPHGREVQGQVRQSAGNQDILHGYAIAQRIHALSSDVLRVEEGALYPALQRMLLKGWVTAEWGISESNRKVRFYQLTQAGRDELEAAMSDYERVDHAIQTVLRMA